MRHRTTSVSKAAVVVSVLSALVAQVHGENRPLEAERSTLTVLVYKSGLFSALADNHVINAPIASGAICEDSLLSIEVTVRSADLRVLDPGLSAERRAERGCSDERCSMSRSSQRSRLHRQPSSLSERIDRR